MASNNYEPSSTGPDAPILIIIITLIVMYILSQINSSRTQTSSGGNSKKEEPYQNLGEVQTALRNAGLEASHLILGIDFTRSNTWSGKRTFQGFCLHDTSRKDVENPYQRVMRIISKSLNCYDEDSLIPAFGFGDIYTKGTSCFPFYPDRVCHGLDEVLHRYNEIVAGIEYSGPTNFAPVDAHFSFEFTFIYLNLCVCR